jgi:hypothetical protein
MNYNTKSSDSKHQDIIKKILKNLYTFDIKDIDKLQDIILANQGRDTMYYIDNIDFHTFTKDSFNYLMQQINVHRNTFHGIGPFINKNGLWYSNKTDRNLEQIIESQTTIIQSQKKEIEELKQKLEFLEEII